MNADQILELEAKGSFDFFWNEANTDPNSPGYGLVRDKTGRDTMMASIASVGFGLTGIIIGIERGWITREEGYERTRGTLNTFLHNAEHSEGFFFHFLNMETAKKYEAFYDCASIIDTAIFLNGAITSAEYFGGEIAEMFEAIYARVDWTKYYDADRNYFFMGYTPENGGFGQWDHYAEQLMQYILGVASPTFPVPATIYDGFDRSVGTYDKYDYRNSPGGQLFTHQFSHAWFDFKGKVDKDGIDWYENSVLATEAARQYCIDHPEKFKTFSENSWGLTACEGPDGYRGYGSAPFHPNCDVNINDGTVAPCASIGSLPFAPEIVKSAVEHFYNEVPQLWSKYGFLDAYNLDKDWTSSIVIGIDKGVSLLMIENYRSNLIYDLYMNNKYVKKASELLGFKAI